MKEARLKKSLNGVLYNSIYMTFLKSQTQISDFKRRWGERLDHKAAEGDFGG